MFDTDANSVSLLQIELPVLSDSYCQYLFRESTSRIDPTSHICAGGNGKDSCQVCDKRVFVLIAEGLTIVLISWHVFTIFLTEEAGFVEKALFGNQTGFH